MSKYKCGQAGSIIYRPCEYTDIVNYYFTWRFYLPSNESLSALFKFRF